VVLFTLHQPLLNLGMESFSVTRRRRRCRAWWCRISPLEEASGFHDRHRRRPILCCWWPPQRQLPAWPGSPPQPRLHYLVKCHRGYGRAPATRRSRVGGLGANSRPWAHTGGRWFRHSPAPIRPARCANGGLMGDRWLVPSSNEWQQASAAGDDQPSLLLGSAPSSALALDG